MAEVQGRTQQRASRFCDTVKEDLMVAKSVLSPDSWAQRQFGQVELGDRRRTQRAVRVGGPDGPTSRGKYSRAGRQLVGDESKLSLVQRRRRDLRSPIFSALGTDPRSVRRWRQACRQEGEPRDLRVGRTPRARAPALCFCASVNSNPMPRRMHSRCRIDNRVGNNVAKCRLQKYPDQTDRSQPSPDQPVV